MDEVYALDMVLILGAQPDDRAVLVIEALPLPVTLRYLEALFPPQPFYPLVIDLPAFNAEYLSNLPVAIAAILLSPQRNARLALLPIAAFLYRVGDPQHS
jgi:hypothetical protein